MKLSEKEVQHIALLARLELSTEELDAFRADLSDILEYVSALGKADTDGVEPMAHSLLMRNVMRDDEVEPCLDRVRESLVSSFPDKGDEDTLKVNAIFS